MTYIRCRHASKAMTYGWASYTSQFPSLMATNIDMLNLLKSRIFQSFLNFLIGAVVEDCGVFSTTVFCDGLDEEIIFIIGDTSCKNFENIFNSK